MKSNKSPLMIVSTGVDKKLRRQRIFWGLIIVLIVSSVFWIAIKLNQPDIFPIAVVKVEGNYPHIDPPTFRFFCRIIKNLRVNFYETF